MDSKVIEPSKSPNCNLCKKINVSFEKILPLVLIGIFIVRLFCYIAKIDYYIGLDNSPIAKSQTIMAIIAIWLQYTVVLITILRNYFEFKVLNNLVRFISIPVYILNLILLNPIVLLLQGLDGSKLLTIMYSLECFVGIFISIYYFIKDLRNKVNYKEILKMIGVLLLLMIASMPGYVPQFLFGYAKTNAGVLDFSIYHRIMLYITVLFPVVIYFGLRNKSQEIIRFSLIYISLATLVGFVVNYDYTTITEPWVLPFHLCNTAMFIIPLCLIFKFKKLFYFTYFINVFGALLAMTFPNYSEGTNILSMRIFTFWYNHIIAFAMPILCVALGEFKRAKLKQFIISMCWFFAYFALVLFLNVYFTSLGHEVDYFFLNGDYIVDMLGEWAEKIYDITATVTVFGKELLFHPLYQSLFFVVYVGLGLAVWFVYEEMFRIAASHKELHLKLRSIKLDDYAKKSVMTKGKKDEFMTNNESRDAKLQLIGFSKKYATSKIYAVKDANLEVSKGEIFGFLGPNGAGKSTIIKSVVGIQPITEGHIEVCGYDVASNPVEAKYNIGYVPDHYALYEKLTGREYINYIADIYDVSQEDRDARIEKYIKIFQLEASIDSKIRTYSHGMKQKITIMSALVHNPKVWILDEPLTGLDPNSIYQVKECMKHHAEEGNIVFFSSHLIDVVEKLCQKIAIIKKGKIQCIKTLEEIEASGTTLEQFYLDIIGDNEDN